MKRVIAISGLPGSGSTTTAKILAEKLNLDYFSPGRLFKDIATGKFSLQYYAPLFKEICTSKHIIIPEFHNTDDSHGTIDLWNTEFGKSSQLHNAIDELQMQLSKKGNIIIDGKLSIEMIKHAHPKIWLTAEFTERANRSAERDAISPEKARIILKQREEKEREEWKAIYGKDYTLQEKQADLIINTTTLSTQEIIKKIEAHLTTVD